MEHTTKKQYTSAAARKRSQRQTQKEKDPNF